MVEVFKTNVQFASDANMLLHHMRNLFPCYQANFDLEDCDRILRIKSFGNINVDSVVRLLTQSGFKCKVLEDELVGDFNQWLTGEVGEDINAKSH